MNLLKNPKSILSCENRQNKYKFGKGEKILSRNDMIEYITERLNTADDYAVEQVYDFLQEVEY